MNHSYYDHPSVPGDPASDLRDALTKDGIEAVLAHTGGGVMSVAVDVGTGHYVLIGVDGDGGEQLATATFVGYDLYEARDHEYVGGAYVDCAAGEATATAVATITKLRESDDPAALVEAA